MSVEKVKRPIVEKDNRCPAQDYGISGQIVYGHTRAFEGQGVRSRSKAVNLDAFDQRGGGRLDWQERRTCGADTDALERDRG